ncbi:MAG: hypothetical protein DMG05_27975 [Acidobacteria bacterium]|nr:MAG: hypothetical protein DMG05_27975 [Acidobacteriota bacterium]
MRHASTIGFASSMLVVLAFLIHCVGLAKDAPYNPVIDPSDFTAKIDNPFYPLKPGRTYTYKGVTDAGEELNTVEVTHSTRVLMGVTCVEVIDTVFVNGALEELTHDWYAQDKQRNVWYFGEDAKQYSNGVVVSTEGSWLAGVNGGLPGIVMEAEPGVGDLYRQEYLKGVAEDMAEVLSLDGLASVPYGTFSDCVVTKDFSPLDRKVVENKWYARGIGFVKSVAVKGGVDTSELVSVK